MRLLSVLTHDVDEPGEGAATMARYVASGHEVMAVTCTGDDGGQGAVAEVLGAGHHRLGFRPTEWLSGDPVPQDRFASVPVAEPLERLVCVLREFRPHVVVVYVDATVPDPDRARSREVSVAAFDVSADPARFPDAGEPWQPLKLYHAHEWYEARIGALHQALLAEGLASPYHQWLEAPVGGAERITTRVRCGEYLPVRDQVLRAHAGRLRPDCHWLAVPVRVRQAVWPTEDFELVRSHVPTSLPEHDLFYAVGAP